MPTKWTNCSLVTRRKHDKNRIECEGLLLHKILSFSSSPPPFRYFFFFYWIHYSANKESKETGGSCPLHNPCAKCSADMSNAGSPRCSAAAHEAWPVDTASHGWKATTTPTHDRYKKCQNITPNVGWWCQWILECLLLRVRHYSLKIAKLHRCSVFTVLFSSISKLRILSMEYLHLLAKENIDF